MRRSRRPRKQKKAPRDEEQEGGEESGRLRSSTRTCRPTATSATGCRATNWTSNTRWRSTGCPGSATITAVTLASLRTFTLDLSDALSVTKVSVNGRRPAQFRSSARQAAHHIAANPLPAGAAMTIVVRYGGTPRPIRSYWGEVGFEELTNGVLVAGQPNGAASWFPCDDHPSAKASFRIQISTESPYYALANGELLSRRARAGMTTWTYEQAEPTSTYLVTLQIGMYDTAPAGQERRPDTRGAAGPVAAQLRPRLRPAAADDEAVRQAVRAVSAVDRLHGGGDRRRPGDTA